MTTQHIPNQHTSSPSDITPEVFIVAALTADGYIARSTHEFANWTSAADKKRFVALTKEAGVMILGSTTFKTFPKPLPHRHHVVYSRTERFEDKWPDDTVETTTEEPAHVIKQLTDTGFKKIAICGGSSIYTQFLASGVITHLYLTIEPVIFGDGIRLFNNMFQEHFTLTLLRSETTEQGTVFLDYLVTKK